MIYSRHKEDAGRDRRVSSRNRGLCMPSAEVVSSFLSEVVILSVGKRWLWRIFFIQELRNHVVNPVHKTVLVSYLYPRGLSLDLVGLFAGERNRGT